MSNNTKAPAASNPRSGETGWRLMLSGIAFAFVCEVLEAVASVAYSSPGERLVSGLTGAGWALLVGSAVYGIRQRARWSTPAALVLSGLALVLVPLSMMGQANAGAAQFTDVGITTALGWIKLAGYTGVVVGWGIGRFGKATARA